MEKIEATKITSGIALIFFTITEIFAILTMTLPLLISGMISDSLPSLISYGCFLTNPIGQVKASDERLQVGNLKVMSGGRDAEGVRIELVGFDIESDPQTMAVLWQNSTADDVSYGESFWIDRSVDGEWISCAKADHLTWHSIAYLVTASSVQQQTYPVSAYYDIAKAGSYRLRTSFYFNKDIPITKAEQHNLWVEFTISD